MKIILNFSALMLAVSSAMGNTAVSEINGKIGVMQGSMDSQDATTLEGSITWPILDSFGIQLDGVYSNVEQRTFGFARPYDVDYGGVGGHFFWRESELAMLGLEAGYVFSNAEDSYEIGIEAERYFEWFTLGAKVGFAGIDYPIRTVTGDSDKDGVFGQLYFGVYPTDNLLITAIVENRFDNTFVGIEVEYELPVDGLSIFASAMKGGSNYDQAFVGMRYYFGEEKPLKRRHRESDPRNNLPGIVSGIATYSKELHQQAQRNVTRPNPSGGSVSGGTLDLGGSGSIGGSGTILNNGGTLGPGNSPGTITLDPGYTLGTVTPTNPSGGSVSGGTLTFGFPDWYNGGTLDPLNSPVIITLVPGFTLGTGGFTFP